ncbi:MAG: hypothetical protein BBJ57_02340 [Desulfobacterales bacterium PC51MH44]|nr:MAG: hypothetical protein BBJ57_02340 [Desulfobacterales bacterium PC51MH44]
MKKASDAEIILSYLQLRSVWRVGDRFGMCGQSVHERLQKLNIKLFNSKLTKEELDRIRDFYKKGFYAGDGALKQFSKEMDRPINTICYMAKQMGLSSSCRNKSAERFVESLKKNGSWPRKGGYSRTKSGKRKDLNNQYFRSGTEANFARYLKMLGIKYEYETKEFVFMDIKRGVIAYTPDFYIPKDDIYYEVKGWLDPKSITRLKRFKKRYPVEFSNTRIIKQRLTGKDYNIFLDKIGFKFDQIIDFKEIEKHKRTIPNWE